MSLDGDFDFAFESLCGSSCDKLHNHTNSNILKIINSGFKHNEMESIVT